MLKAFSDIFDKTFRGGPAESHEDRDRAVRLATALLLVEVARADYREDLAEDEAVRALLKEFFELSDAEAALLTDEARGQADDSVSLQAFTRRLHESLTMDEKHRVVEMLWKVALADSRLDKLEDHMVRKVAALLYVPHGDLIRIRNRVKGE